jgi:hypothetical protein
VKQTTEALSPFATIHLKRNWLRHRAANRKIGGSIPDEVIEFFSSLFLPAALGNGVYLACNRHEYQKFS